MGMRSADDEPVPVPDEQRRETHVRHWQKINMSLGMRSDSVSSSSLAVGPRSKGVNTGEGENEREKDGSVPVREGGSEAIG